MSFLDLAEKLLNVTTTEKGDKAYFSTENACLDYFYLAGGKRGEIRSAVWLFVKAYLESPITALKLLLYTRNIKSGLGERDLFRNIMYNLAQYEPETALKIMPYIPEYGRYDDLLCLLYTPIGDQAIAFMKKQLDEDMENKKAGKPISLLAKWMPSINTSNDLARRDAAYIAMKLNMSKADYRKMLSFLRKDLIIENNLRERDYTFDYQNVPSAAMNNYRGAFIKHDEERFNEYIDTVAQGKSKMNIGVLDPVAFIKRAKREMNNRELKEYYETTWNQLVNESALNKKTLVVRDGSGSMYNYRINPWTDPIDVADALTLLTATRLTGEFKDKFITFSFYPKLIDLSKKKSIFSKILYLSAFNDWGTTNIKAVYDLIINVYSHKDFKKEDAIDQIMIISDMEFDSLDGDIHDENSMSTFEYFKEKFAEIGYKMPEIIFWNVAARGERSPVLQDETGVKLVSGGTKNIIDMVVNTESVNPLDFMNKVLEQYAFVDKLFD